MILDKQIAVITGGASGMGRACVELLHSRGVKTVIWDKILPSLEKKSGIYAIVCDVSRADDVEDALQETVAHVGVPRIVINCAGVAPAQRMVGKQGVMPLAAFQQVIDINLVGTFNVMRVVAHAMVASAVENNAEERGVIINTASIAAFEGQIGQMAYSASKGGIVAMTLPAARELAQHAIRVNTIAPGAIATPLLQAMPEEVQTGLSGIFPKRLGKPEEFAALVLHLIENAFINGEVIRLDGALRMPAR